MDIDLFSEMIKNLILDNDEVTLPGLGTFVSEMMPAAFSDKGYTINPPYRRLSFRQWENSSDSALCDFYSKVNNLDGETSSRILGDFISGLRDQLLTKKLVVLPGLGRLRATKENTFFFIADEDLDIYPYGYGLGPVSLKTHEETGEEVSAAVEELQRIVEGTPEEAPTATESLEATEQPEADGQTEAIPAETEAPAETEIQTQIEAPAETEAPDEPQEPARLTYKFNENPLEEARRKHRKVLFWILGILGLIVLALGIFVLLAHIAPDFIDSILYTPEELKIINY